MAAAAHALCMLIMMWFKPSWLRCNDGSTLHGQGQFLLSVLVQGLAQLSARLLP
jgi:hypothetical protein